MRINKIRNQFTLKHVKGEICLFVPNDVKGHLNSSPTSQLPTPQGRSVVAKSQKGTSKEATKPVRSEVGEPMRGFKYKFQSRQNSQANLVTGQENHAGEEVNRMYPKHTVGWGAGRTHGPWTTFGIP